MKIGRTLAAGMLLAVVSCDNPAAPAPDLAIQVDGPAVVASSVAPEEGVQCGLHLRASARGEGHARWLGARFVWKDVTTGTILGTGRWDEAGTRGFWQADGIAAGQVLTSNAGAIGGPHAFVLQVTFEFTPDGGPDVRTVSHSFTCGGAAAS